MTLVLGALELRKQTCFQALQGQRYNRQDASRRVQGEFNCRRYVTDITFNCNGLVLKLLERSELARRIWNLSGPWSGRDVVKSCACPGTMKEPHANSPFLQNSSFLKSSGKLLK
eukprot:TRINITY_DN9176_c0_g1_i2.p2 TRINITY_DN9176_c0_g1~~TRINITY_DN9176_c0_g1_i2.p2  ORF type:complete len:114 (+),score=0.60 TRINITY_DN9176_c0_g1_i2:450-791(+)